ncbi:MAG TPA: cytochrome c-type biogenesis CcmF C-terminal domain-containing protein [bacterium]|nr:cytochrome c-type biogenesis CcmF C-terminal domain-containing protein [bacterium]
MPIVGFSALIIASGMSLYAGVLMLFACHQDSYRFYRSARRASQAVFFFLSLAAIALLVALLSRDFTIEYVAHYTNRSLSLFYTIAAFWAGQAGSLLLWAWLLAAFTWWFTRRPATEWLVAQAVAQSVLNFLLLFFLYLLVFKSNPFKLLEFQTADGVGLNPLLQNPAMVFHPPALYIGFVAYSVPFALTAGALLQRLPVSRWIDSLRRWSLFAWMFLTLGNLLGMQWAYVELGWGGYWAWDPVENASLLPWLTGTAMLHSILLHKQRRMMPVGMFVLVFLTFSLTIFGTFVTRSGMIASVHAFGVSNLGPAFLLFLSLIVLGSVFLLLSRRQVYKSAHAVESWTGKESSFLVSTALLIALMIGVFIGTLMPAISEWLNGRQINLTMDFYNQLAALLGPAIVLLLGLCHLLSWHRTPGRQLWKRSALPIAIGLGVALFAFFLSPHTLRAKVASAIFAFSLAAVAITKLRPVFSCNALSKKGLPALVSHIGVLLFFIGIVGSSSHYREKTVSINRGEWIDFAPYRLNYLGLESLEWPDRQIDRAIFAVYSGNDSIGTFCSEKQNFLNFQPATEVGIRTTLTHDLYLILGAVDKENDRASISLLYNPLVVWIWIGGGMMVIGTLASLFMRKRSDPKQKEEM